MPSINTPTPPYSKIIIPQPQAIAKPVSQPVQSSPWLWLVLITGVGVLILGSILFAIFFGILFSNQPKPAPATQATKTPELTTPAVEQPTISTISALPSPTLGIGYTQVSPKDGMELVYIPAGEFLMGSTDSDHLAYVDEKPQHSVYLDAFWIDKTEVTNAMFARFVEETGYQTEAEKRGNSVTLNLVTGDWNQVINGADWQHPQGSDSNIRDLENHPVVNVNWNDAIAYCQWVERRLPTEAEWEKAARGVDGRLYPWGNKPPAGNLVNFADRNLKIDGADMSVGDGYTYTSPVGNYPNGASPYSALDMAGNVLEWVEDWYAKDYYASITASAQPVLNPKGSAHGSDCVIRGGSWAGNAMFVRVTMRDFANPTYTLTAIGFRCAISP